MEMLDIPDPYASDEAARPRVPDVAALPPSPTRRGTWALRAGAVVAVLACEALLVGAMGLRDGATLTASVVGYGIVLPLVSAAMTLAVLQASSSRRGRVFVAIAGGSLVFLVTALLSRAPGDESGAGMVRCVLGGSMMATAPILLAVFSMRHAFVTGATWRTAALGLASGLVGAVATRLYCPDDAFVHVVVGHGVPVLLAVLAAAALGPRFTRA